MPKLPESYYSSTLAKRLGGKTEVSTPIGRIDVLTDDEVIEVKFSHDWKAGIGQALAYANFHPGKKPRLHLIGSLPCHAMDACMKMGIELTCEPEIEAGDKTLKKAPLKTNPIKSIAVPGQEQCKAMISLANNQLKEAGISVRISAVNRTLYLVAEFPPKDNAGRSDHHFQRVSLKIGASPAGISIAEEAARGVDYLLRVNQFKWEDLKRISDEARDRVAKRVFIG